MKPTADNSSFPSTLLTASIFLAQIDVQGLTDYALKAGIGGAIWLAYKVIADRFALFRKSKEAQTKQP